LFDSLSKSNDIGAARKVIGVLNPQSSMFLPWISMIKGMDLCLQIRPVSEKQQGSYSWGHIVTMGPTDHLASQQASVLSLAHLKESDMLFYCSADFGARPTLWFSAGVDASALQTEFNEPVPDWKISVNSVFRLENKLPYEAEYAIWEKASDGNLVERQHSIVSSGGCACIYAADMHKSIYLTMFVQGSWTLEKVQPDNN
jgi:vacuolar protein sorting-associated protein 13A/C